MSTMPKHYPIPTRRIEDTTARAVAHIRAKVISANPDRAHGRTLSKIFDDSRLGSRAELASAWVFGDDVEADCSRRLTDFDAEYDNGDYTLFLQDGRRVTVDVKSGRSWGKTSIENAIANPKFGFNPRGFIKPEWIYLQTFFSQDESVLHVIGWVWGHEIINARNNKAVIQSARKLRWSQLRDFRDLLKMAGVDATAQCTRTR